MYHLYKKYAKVFLGSLLFLCSACSLHATQPRINSQAAAIHPLFVEGYVRQEIDPTIIIKPITTIIATYAQPIKKIQRVGSFSSLTLDEVYLGLNDFIGLSCPCPIHTPQTCTLYEGDIAGKKDVRQLAVEKHQPYTMFRLLALARGKFVLTSSPNDKLKLWDAASGKMVKEFDKSLWPLDTCKPLDNDLFITMDTHQYAAIWSLEKSCPLLEYKVPEAHNVDFSFNKKYIFCLTFNLSKAQIDVYETKLREGQAALPQINRWSIGCKLLKDNGLLLCADDAICLTIDGDGRLIKWKVGNNEPIHTILLKKEMLLGGCCRLSEKRIGLLSRDGTKIQVYDIVAMKPVKIITIKDVRADGLTKLSSDHFVAHSAKKNKLILFDTATLQSIATIPTNAMALIELNAAEQPILRNNIVTIAPKQFVLATCDHVYLFVITGNACHCIYEYHHSQRIRAYIFSRNSSVFFCSTESQTPQSESYLFKYT